MQSDTVLSPHQHPHHTVHGMAPDAAHFLPVGLRVTGQSIVIIGGGRVALQKLRVLTRTAARISVCASRVSQDVRQLGVAWREEPYEPSQLAGAFLVYACTDNKPLNAQIARDARRIGALVNAADDPANCDIISPAVWTCGVMTVSVLSDGTNAKRSVEWRNRIRELASDDPVLR